MYKYILSGLIISASIYIYNKNNIDTSKLKDFNIIIGPGGYYGFYMLGICHYIRNTYNLKDIKMIGFSAGSMAILFMSLSDAIVNDYLRKLLNHKIDSDLSKLANNIFSHMKEDIKYKDLELSNKYIGLTTSSYTMDIYHSFISTDDMVNCCQASSFVPMITNQSLLCYYFGNTYFDGALSYWNIKQHCNKKTLIISYKMFGRYSKNKVMTAGLIYEPGMSIYNMYILGYHDALNNKEYLDSFLI